MTQLSVALVGGDGRVNAPYPRRASVRRFASTRFAGNGPARQVRAAIESGCVDVVVLLVRWIGHPASESIRRACRRHGVRLVVVPGGEASAIRAVRELLRGAP